MAEADDQNQAGLGPGSAHEYVLERRQACESAPCLQDHTVPVGLSTPQGSYITATTHPLLQIYIGGGMPAAGAIGGRGRSLSSPALNVIGFQTLPCKTLKNLKTLNPTT